MSICLRYQHCFRIIFSSSQGSESTERIKLSNFCPTLSQTIFELMVKLEISSFASCFANEDAQTPQFLTTLSERTFGHALTKSTTTVRSFSPKSCISCPMMMVCSLSKQSDVRCEYLWAIPLFHRQASILEIPFS